MRSAFISDMKSSKSNGNFRALVCVCKNVNIMRQNMKIYQLFHQHFRPFNILVCAEFDLNFIPLHSKLIQKICITNHENFHGKMENVWVKSSRLRSFEIKYLGKKLEMIRRREIQYYVKHTIYIKKKLWFLSSQNKSSIIDFLSNFSSSNSQFHLMACYTHQTETRNRNWTQKKIFHLPENREQNAVKWRKSTQVISTFQLNKHEIANL